MPTARLHRTQRTVQSMGGALNALADVRLPLAGALDGLASTLASSALAGSPSAMAGHPSPFSNAEAFASLLEGLDSPPGFVFQPSCQPFTRAISRGLDFLLGWSGGLATRGWRLQVDEFLCFCTWLEEFSHPGLCA